ncbi:MAG: substrate-binding domain-containing protein [Lactobacillus paragasseri]|nr:substrate-binding domain-containing protein [Lactobacillus paragasseri]
MKKLYGISKVIFPLLIIGLIIYLFYAQPFGHRPIKFGSTYMTMNNDFYQTLNEPIANEIDDHNDILYSRNPELSVNNQVNEINNFIKNEVKVIFINPVDGTSTKLIRALKKAHQAGIKIIVVDSQLENSSNYVDCTIRSNNYQAGVLCAKELMSKQKSANILILQQPTAISVVDRIKGFENTIKNNKSSKIAIYSIHGSENKKKMLSTQNANVKATVAQSPLQIGKVAIKVAYKLINHQKVKKEIILPVKLITSKNIKNFNITGWQ